MLRAMTSRVGALWSSILLVLGLSVAVAAPAQAATPATLSLVEGIHVVDATGPATNVHVGWDNSSSTVTFQASYGFATGSLPSGCYAQNTPPLGQYVHCNGSAVQTVAVFFGAGSDLLRVNGVCIPYVYAEMGDGSDDFEYLDCNSATSEVYGEGGDDFIHTGDGPDGVDAGPGNDDVATRGGDDTVLGGDGNDKLQGGAGNDTISGGTGNDTIFPSAGNDTVNGDDGDDTLTDETWDQDTGADDLRGGGGVDTLDLADHPEGATIRLDDVANDGNSGEGDNYHSDFERTYGTQGADVIVGTAGNDWVRGGSGDDVIQGLGGNDEIDGDSNNDTIDGGDGNDILYGGYGNDDVTGGAGVDSLYGDYTSCSSYSCPAGSDILRARDGAVDAVNCGSGADQAIVDRVDVLGADGFQICEAVDAAGPAAAPPAGSEPTVKVGKATRSKGVTATLTCASACKATGKVVVSKKVKKALKLKSTVLGTAKKSLSKAGTLTIKIKIATWAQQRLKRKGKIKATLSITLKAGTTTKVSKAIKLKP